MKERRLGGLVRRMKHPQQAIPPTNGGTCRVDPVIPIVLHIAITLPATARRGITNKLPLQPNQSPQRRKKSLVLAMIFPPLENGFDQLGFASGRHIKESGRWVVGSDQ